MSRYSEEAENEKPKKYDLDDDEFKKLIETAVELSQKKKSGYSVEEINETARNLGIPEDKIQEAYDQIIRIKEEQNKRKDFYKNFFRRYWIGLLIIAIVVGFFMYNLIPQNLEKFDGKIELVMTNELVGNKAKDILTSISLIKNQNGYFQTKFFDLKHGNYPIKWEFYTPDGKFYSRSDALMGSPLNGGATSIAELKLNLKVPTGQWSVKIFLENQLVKTQKFEVEMGKFDIRFCSSINSKNEPINTSEEFFFNSNMQIYCHLDFGYNFTRKSSVEWKWFDEQGKEFYNYTLNTDPPKETDYWLWNRLDQEKFKIGKLKVEFYIDDVKVGEKYVTIKEGGTPYKKTESKKTTSNERKRESDLKLGDKIKK